MNRAYAVLASSKPRRDGRTITGIATTPTPDRAGRTSWTPLGATFTLPDARCCWHHDQQQPIGWTSLENARRRGIVIKATIAADRRRQAALEDRLDEAVAARSRAGLVRGALDRLVRQSRTGSSALRCAASRAIVKCEIWAELSAVTIPANT